MSNTKYKPMEPLSDWVEYKLKTELLDPPVFRCRLRPVTELNMLDGMGFIPDLGKMGKATIEVAVEAVAEWDLAVEGTLIPLTPENKRGWLVPIIAEEVLEREPGMLLGICIVQDAKKRENFLKNSPATSPGGSK
ncbi:MAG: hypothetical protein IMZ54_11780 [Acidobacteria bacterium]|nr:hypothetical protein [Acidobacteriota bacterium]